jgi:cytochrome c-type biogenesis protein CcsB
MTAEIVAMWVAVTFYALGTAAYIFGVTLEREKLMRLAFAVSTVGMLPHLVAFAVRWVRIGRGPILGFYEAASKLALLSVLVFALLAWRQPRLKPLGVAIMPVVTLLIAGAMLSPKSELAITGALASYWLIVHIAFANLAFASFVASFALAVGYVVRARSVEGPWARHLAKLPAQEIIDDLSARLAIVGFLFWGVMIASGAIWANESWGRYWGWDPIETWSLVVWLVYAAYLHARIAMGWRGEKSAWLAIVAMPLCAFSLLGVPTVFKSVHGGYLAL